jgi:hypothetical protein
VNRRLRPFAAELEQPLDIGCWLVCKHSTYRTLVQAFGFVSAAVQESLNLTHLIDAGDPTVCQDGNFTVDCCLFFENDLLYCLSKFTITIKAALIDYGVELPISFCSAGNKGGSR